MTRPFSNLIPALVAAGSILAASALVTALPGTALAAVGAPIVLVIGLIVSDLIRGLRDGRRLPSPGALILAVSILVACRIVAADDSSRLAAMIPIFGGCAVLPGILRRSSRESLR